MDQHPNRSSNRHSSHGRTSGQWDIRQSILDAWIDMALDSIYKVVHGSHANLPGSELSRRLERYCRKALHRRLSSFQRDWHFSFKIKVQGSASSTMRFKMPCATNFMPASPVEVISPVLVGVTRLILSLQKTLETFFEGFVDQLGQAAASYMLE
ncbi:hypothetical protein BV25DRAFT_1839299 [Artomyces pyxidatus]|uniref:Uncharacterized protein n=1 Tax=Artomyces pyxidatus TaxID=48021 RepID=A0ACB8SYJ9_9AGAM|nr:hypothetical protein BV25DRAFT_1839299 [Artomyces pyxidatus]